MYKLTFTPAALKAIAKWKKSNPILFKKASKIFEDMAQHPREGLGHPEPLVGGDNTKYSRRISAHDRVVYNIWDNELVILIIQAGSHYDDK